MAVRASLIVPVFKGWTYCRALLRSVEPEELAASHIEVLVVDDASLDGGAQAIQNEFPGVRVIVRAGNGGFAAAVNTGIGHAMGETLVVANSDLLMRRDALERLIEEVERAPRILAAPRTYSPDGAEACIGQRWPTPTSSVAELFALVAVIRALRSRLGGNVAVRTGHVDWVIGSCMCFSREYLEAAGPLDERYFMYGEELAWQRAASREGMSARVIDDVFVIHDEGHGTTPTSSRAVLRFKWIWSNRLSYFLEFDGRFAWQRTRLYCVLAVLTSIPFWLALSVFPRLRSRAQVEQQKLLILWHLIRAGRSAVPVNPLAPARHNHEL